MIVALLVASVFFLLLAFWVRAAGSAIGRVPRADALRDKADGRRGADRVAILLEDREVLVPAVGVVASGILILGSVFATAVVVAGRSAGEAAIGALAIGIVAFLVGDLVPRQVGRWNPRRVAYRSAGLLTLSVRLGGWANDLIPEPDEVEDDDYLDEADEQERELIDSVLEFGETIVREVMTPRPDMVTIPVTSPIGALVDLATQEGFSRLPVSSEGDIVGLVIMKDLLKLLADDQRPTSVAEVMRPVEFVPETKHASALLAEMQASHGHQVVVVDEYGDVVGLVTIEDLLEELVGEITDETDDDEALITRTERGWDVDARLPVDDLAKELGVELPQDDWDTVGGLVLGVAERVPEVGEQFEVGNVAMKVEKMQGRRVSAISITLKGRVEAS